MKLSYLTMIIVLCANTGLSAQVELEGPSCVVPGLSYVYKLRSNAKDTSSFLLCVTNGQLEGAKTRCSRVIPNTLVKIIWDEAGSGILSINATGSRSSISVTISTPLNGGEITNERKQSIKFDALPNRNIECSPATGGDCNARYLYQWQVSGDNVNWKEIPNANDQNLRIGARLKSSFYYRRQVTELNSKDVAYSSYSTVFVEPEEKK